MKKEHVKAIICAILLLAGGLFVAFDGAVSLGASRGIQYAVNTIFLFIYTPVLLYIGDYPSLFYPETKY